MLTLVAEGTSYNSFDCVTIVEDKQRSFKDHKGSDMWIKLFSFFKEVILALDNEADAQVYNYERVFYQDDVEHSTACFQCLDVMREKSQYPACHE